MGKFRAGDPDSISNGFTGVVMMDWSGNAIPEAGSNRGQWLLIPIRNAAYPM
jgi:hypothetical protein